MSEVFTALVRTSFAVDVLLEPGAQLPETLILRARKAVGTPTRLLPGLVLHRPDGSYTAEADAILREGEGLTP